MVVLTRGWLKLQDGRGRLLSAKTRLINQPKHPGRGTFSSPTAGRDWQNGWKYCKHAGLSLDKNTIVIVDIDKTALGARGRNHSPIDVARVQAISQTVQQALGDDADINAFTEIYLELNQQKYHDLTGDNQDYLAYISILVGAGVVPLTDIAPGACRWRS